MSFLRTYQDENKNAYYEAKINDMCTDNKQSLEITFHHLSAKLPTLAIWIAEQPMLLLPILSNVTEELVTELYPEYHRIHKEIFVRIKDLPIEDNLRDLRQIHMNGLIKIKGVVTKRTGVFPELQKMFFRCACGDLKGPVYNNNLFEAKQFLGQCVICQSNGPYQLDD
jgi:DNA replication licensing factor MCM2